MVISFSRDLGKDSQARTSVTSSCHCWIMSYHCFAKILLQKVLLLLWKSGRGGSEKMMQPVLEKCQSELCARIKSWSCWQHLLSSVDLDLHGNLLKIRAGKMPCHKKITKKKKDKTFICYWYQHKLAVEHDNFKYWWSCYFSFISQGCFFPPSLINQGVGTSWGKVWNV